MRALPVLVVLILLAGAGTVTTERAETVDEEVPLAFPPPPLSGSPSPVPPLPPIPGSNVIVDVPRMQNEFSIAANPNDPDHLVAGANDYSPGDVWAAVYVSRDGGLTWSHGYIPLPAVYTVSGDPVLAFDNDGRVYYAGIAFNRGSTNGGANAIFVSRSDDGGDTWTSYVPYSSPTGAHFHDKPWINTDPATGDVLLSYTHFGAGGGILFSKSSDGGATWSPRVNLGGGQFSLPVAGTDGELYVTWAGSSMARFARSTDGGLSFTTSSVIGLGHGQVPVPFRYFSYPVMDVARGGPHEGRIYLAAPQFAAEGANLQVLYSDDGGRTWSTPTALARPGAPLMPWMAIAPDGTVGIAYMDTALSPNSWGNYGGILGPVTSGETWLMQTLSTLDPATGNWWTTFVSDVPSRASAAVFWGDYQGMAATAKGFHPVWGDARFEGPCNCVGEARVNLATVRVPLDRTALQEQGFHSLLEGPMLAVMP